MRGECPQMLKKATKSKGRKPRAMVATWSDDESEQESEKSNSEDEIGLMAFEDKDTEVSTSYDSYTVDDWIEEYASLMDKFKEIRRENRHLKKKINNMAHSAPETEEQNPLSQEIENLKSEKESLLVNIDNVKLSLQEKDKELKSVSEKLVTAQSENLTLQTKLTETENTLKKAQSDLAKLVDGKENLNALLGNKINVGKLGLGFVPTEAKKKKNKHGKQAFIVQSKNPRECMYSHFTAPKKHHFDNHATLKKQSSAQQGMNKQSSYIKHAATVCNKQTIQKHGTKLIQKNQNLQQRHAGKTQKNTLANVSNAPRK